MKITALKCTVIGDNPVLRIVTDEGISGYAQAESAKTYLKPHVMFYEKLILGEDPRDVERVMTRIRRVGSFKPWGAAVSAIEMALWDIAGQAAGVPVYRLLGGKVRDRVCVYNGNVRFPMEGRVDPQAHADNMQKMIESPENFRFIKQGIAFHSGMPHGVDGFSYGEPQPGGFHPNRGLLTGKGFAHMMACIEAMREVCGTDVGLALDCGPGMVVPDAIKLAKACEALDVMWLEDMITGDYTPYVLGICTARSRAARRRTFIQVSRSTCGRTLSNSSKSAPSISSAPIRQTSAASPNSNGWRSTPTCMASSWHRTAQGTACSGWRRWCRSVRRCQRTSSPSSTPRAAPNGGMTSSTVCPIPSLPTATSRSGTDRVWGSPSASMPQRNTCPQGTGISSTNAR